MDDSEGARRGAWEGMTTAEQAFHVVVRRVIYEKAAARGQKGGSWYVLATDQGRASGVMSWRPEPGERLKLTGKVGVYAGEKELKFASALPDVPQDEHALLTYVCGRAHGVGDSLRDAIWAAHGEKWRTAVSRRTLDGVEGLGPQRLASIAESMHAAETEGAKGAAIGRLLDLGASDNLAAKAWDEWELECVPRVERDPYCLTDLDNVGFVQVDQTVARALGITGTDPRRMAAGLAYSVKQTMSQGDTLLCWDVVAAEAARCLREATPQQIVTTCKELFEAGVLVAFPDPDLGPDGVKRGRVGTSGAVDAARCVVEFVGGVEHG